MNIVDTLKVLFPNIVFPDDCVIVQRPDEAPSIVEWNRPEPQPTEDQLAAASAQAEALAAARQSAWSAAAAAFEALPLGKQALWEPVRAKVAEYIASGDFTAAYTTIATVPTLYEGMEADRAAFLALFQGV